MRMDRLRQDARLFFDCRQQAYPLYDAFADRVLARFPNTVVRVQKTQITFSDRYVYACVSLRPVGKKAELPEAYVVITLGLPVPLCSPRAARQTEPYPGRWTVHIVVGSPEELDEELFFWVEQAHAFARAK